MRAQVSLVNLSNANALTHSASLKEECIGGEEVNKDFRVFLTLPRRQKSLFNWPGQKHGEKENEIPHQTKCKLHRIYRDVYM